MNTKLLSSFVILAALATPATAGVVCANSVCTDSRQTTFSDQQTFSLAPKVTPFTAVAPILGGAGGTLAQGARSGNTTTFVTSTGTLTSGHSGVFDASGNVIDAGNYALAGGAPAASVCGTSPAVSTGSSNLAGEVTTGTGGPTACTVTFSAAFPTHAFCAVTPEFAASTATAHISALSNSAFTVAFSAGVTSGKFTYVCGGN